MTSEPRIWLVCLSDAITQRLATALAADTDLEPVELRSLDEALTLLVTAVPRLAVANGNLDATARLKLYSAIQDAAPSVETPVIFVDTSTAVRLELVGPPEQLVDTRNTASDVGELVRLVFDRPDSSEAAATPHEEKVAEPILEQGPAVVAAQPTETARADRIAEPEEGTFGQIAGALMRRWWLALAVLATVMAADYYYTATREKTYLARASLIISPSANVDRGSLVYSVDSLGRGRIVGTYAEVLGSELVHREALARLGYAPTALNTIVTFKSSTVADTAVVQVTAESPDPELSAQAANLAGEVGIEHMGDLFPVYNLVFLSRANPPMMAYRPDPIRNYSIGFLVGILLAIVVAYVVDTAARKARSVIKQQAPTAKAPPEPKVTAPRRASKLEPQPKKPVTRFSFFAKKPKPAPAVQSAPALEQSAPWLAPATEPPVTGEKSAPKSARWGGFGQNEEAAQNPVPTTPGALVAPVTAKVESSPKFVRKPLFGGLFQPRPKVDKSTANSNGSGSQNSTADRLERVLESTGPRPTSSEVAPTLSTADSNPSAPIAVQAK